MAYATKKENPIECTRVIPDLIAKNEKKQVYLLYGEERYLVKQNKDNLMKYLNPNGDTMNIHYYAGTGLNVKEIIDAAETMPFFADYRLIVIEQSDLFSSNGEELAEYLPTAPETTIFIFIEQTVDGRCKLAKTIKQQGVAVNYMRQTTATLETWVKAKVRQTGKVMSPSAISYFVKKIGDNMQLMEKEIDKVISYTWDKEEITVQDVNAVCITTLEDHIFEMIDALSKKDQKTTLNLYHDLLALKVAPAKILALINGEFARLLTMKNLFDKGMRSKQVAETMQVKEFMVTVRMPILAKYTEQQLKECLNEGILSDQSFKEGRINDRLAVEVLLVQLTSGPNA